jgi:hypothetical protein
VFIFDLRPKFQGQTKAIVFVLHKNVCKSVPVLDIKFIFIINDHCKTVKKIKS